MRTIRVAPDPALLESMRSIGYTVEAAVADVIDNSVAANANVIDILVSASGPFELAVLDDGFGMNREDAIAAMTLAANSPSAQRDPMDLGRFGLGLKTASLSQCRSLTLITKTNKSLTALRWDLDHVLKVDDWSLIELDPEQIEPLLGWKKLDNLSNGTLVHWGNLDQLKLTEGAAQDDLDRVAQRIRDHVALVFHLFNGGHDARKIEFRINGSPVVPLDPFMSHLKLTNKTPWESIDIEGQEIRLMAYTLPYLNRLTEAERKLALGLGTLRETQGFYVYRGHRLVIWGNWFRVLPRSEMAKLTRVRVEIPNSLDHLWALDVKKSRAEPPPQVRRRLRELAATMMLPGKKVQEFRGRRVDQASDVDYMWVSMVNGDQFSYEINVDHPTISSFFERLSAEQEKHFTRVLEDIQNTFPIIDAHNKMSNDGIPQVPDDESVIERALDGWRLAEKHQVDLNMFIQAISRSEPYCLVSDFESKFRKVLAK